MPGVADYGQRAFETCHRVSAKGIARKIYFACRTFCFEHDLHRIFGFLEPLRRDGSIHYQQVSINIEPKERCLRRIPIEVNRSSPARPIPVSNQFNRLCIGILPSVFCEWCFLFDSSRLECSSSHLPRAGIDEARFNRVMESLATDIFCLHSTPFADNSIEFLSDL